MISSKELKLADKIQTIFFVIGIILISYFNLFNPKDHIGLITRSENEFKMIYHGTIAERFGLKMVLNAIKKSISSLEKVNTKTEDVV